MSELIPKDMVAYLESEQLRKIKARRRKSNETWHAFIQHKESLYDLVSQEDVDNRIKLVNFYEAYLHAKKKELSTSFV